MKSKRIKTCLRVLLWFFIIVRMGISQPGDGIVSVTDFEINAEGFTSDNWVQIILRYNNTASDSEQILKFIEELLAVLVESGSPLAALKSIETSYFSEMKNVKIDFSLGEPFTGKIISSVSFESSNSNPPSQMQS